MCHNKYVFLPYICKFLFCLLLEHYICFLSKCCRPYLSYLWIILVIYQNLYLCSRCLSSIRVHHYCTKCSISTSKNSPSFISVEYISMLPKSFSVHWVDVSPHTLFVSEFVLPVIVCVVLSLSSCLSWVSLVRLQFIFLDLVLVISCCFLLGFFCWHCCHWHIVST